MASVEKSRCAATAIAPGLIALAVQKTPQRRQLQYVLLRVEMRCINPRLRGRRSCGEREAPAFSLAILNVKYGKPTRNLDYSELPSGINAALETTGHPNVPDPQGTPGDLILYPGATGWAYTFLPGGNATTRALYECNFARARLQFNAPIAAGPHLYSTVPVRRGWESASTAGARKVVIPEYFKAMSFR